MPRPPWATHEMVASHALSPRMPASVPLSGALPQWHLPNLNDSRRTPNLDVPLRLDTIQ